MNSITSASVGSAVTSGRLESVSSPTGSLGRTSGVSQEIGSGMTSPVQLQPPTYRSEAAIIALDDYTNKMIALVMALIDAIFALDEDDNKKGAMVAMLDIAAAVVIHLSTQIPYNDASYTTSKALLEQGYVAAYTNIGTHTDTVTLPLGATIDRTA